MVAAPSSFWLLLAAECDGIENPYGITGSFLIILRIPLTD
jgi:hypothetical protein